MDRVNKITPSISHFINYLLGADCKEAKIIPHSSQSVLSENRFNPIPALVNRASVCRGKLLKREIREYK
jgi:hypothetical protein